MRIQLKSTKIIVILMSVALLSSCAGISPKATLYTLDDLAFQNVASQGAMNADKAPVKQNIQIMPISIIETVDRPQIVIQTAAQQVKLLEQQRWAQPLKYEISRVVAGYLNEQLPTANAVAYPHQISYPDVQLSIQVLKFESSYFAPAKIEVNYIIKRIKSNQIISQHKIYTQSLTSNVHDDNLSVVIEAHNINLKNLSHDIANTLTSF